MTNKTETQPLVPSVVPETDTTVTFNCFSDKKEEFQVTVKSAFFQQEKKPDTTKTLQEIVVEYNILPFLHNTEGPALLNLKSKEPSYWVNGRILNHLEEGKKLQHTADFNKGVEEILEIK